MKRGVTATIVSLLLGASLLPAADQVGEVRAVYVLPMGQGLDQHIANRLANAGVFSVVADIARADAVITSSLGKAFEVQLADLIEDSLPPEVENEDAAEQKATPQSVNRPPISTFGRGRGTVFLVDIGSRKVLWSTYVPARNDSPKALDKAAGEIVERLEKALNRSN